MRGRGVWVLGWGAIVWGMTILPQVESWRKVEAREGRISFASSRVTSAAGAVWNEEADDDPVRAANDHARTELRAGRPEEAARRLKAVDPQRDTRDPEQARRWWLLAKDAAIRTGDRAWLEEVNSSQVSERFAFADGYAILTAWSYLKAADFEKTRFHLDQIRDPAHLNEREKRRLLSILARMEQLEGRPEAERVHIDKLVDYLGRWATPICQSCHENPDHPGELPALDVNHHWIGQRYVALLAATGDAARIRDEAQARLSEEPTDERARLRLAYALRALGDEPAALAQFRELDWAAFADRPTVEPRDMLIFP